eukprot:scaffold289503_cov23-Tisochrysis_lutea.AAC.1
MRTGNTKGSTSEKVAVGHLDEVLELQGGGANLFSGLDLVLLERWKGFHAGCSDTQEKKRTVYASQ